MNIFCTLFDSNYLDKGIVMYRSLVDTGCVFRMYVLAMDERCASVLGSYHYDNLMIISLDKFINKNGLETIKKQRPVSEFCWTCTSFLIDYVLHEYNEPVCTYIDADLYFFLNPKCLIDEMGEKCVQIIKHGFDNTPVGRIALLKSGTYCVEFNTFKNCDKAQVLLDWWKERCYESCTIDNPPNGIFGDQGYLEKWGDEPAVCVMNNLGGGVAPWNISRYKLDHIEGCIPFIVEKRKKCVFPIVFYHFHNITYINQYEADICAYDYGNIDDDLALSLYEPYLRKLDAAKKELKDKFGFMPLLLSHPAFSGKKKKKDNSFMKSEGHFLDRVYIMTIDRVSKHFRLKKNRYIFNP